MHGDFSRDTFTIKQNFTRVLMQQGRLIVDADWNEQSAITLSYLQTLAADLIGWHGGPGVAPGNGKPFLNSTADTGPFIIKKEGDGFKVAGEGHYYVDGLCIRAAESLLINVENKEHDDSLNNVLCFLDIWESHATSAGNPDLLDVAYGGLDTASRVQTMVFVRQMYTEIDAANEKLSSDKDFRTLLIKHAAGDIEPPARRIDLRGLHEKILPRLTAWGRRTTPAQENCGEEEQSGFTGLENQLYRVEVHSAGKDGKTFWAKPKQPLTPGTQEYDTDLKNQADAVTLKWSRDNGSVVFPAIRDGSSLVLKTKWRDESRAIKNGHWIEVLEISGETGVLIQVADVGEVNGMPKITWKTTTQNLPSGDVLVRRWDHRERKDFPLRDGGIIVQQSTDGVSVKIPVEDGLEVQVSLADSSGFRAGDHWLIPARAATGDIIWPKDPATKKNSSVPARYTVHHYAPIALKVGDTILDFRNNISAAGEFSLQLPYADPLIIDVSKASLFLVTMTAKCEIKLTGGNAGQRFTLRVTQAGTGALTWSSGIITWAGGAVPVAPATGKTSIFEFLQTGGATWFGTAVGTDL